jgi:NADPH2 dehydrogenase
VAERVRREAELPVAASWYIDTPQLANQVIADGQMDLVMIGRAHLENPHWAYFAARELGEAQPAQVLPQPYAHWLSRYRRS